MKTKHRWFCRQAGLFVSLFECKRCHSETRDPHDRLECKGPVFRVGDRVRRADLEPFEVDLLITKLRQASGTITRIIPDLGPEDVRPLPKCYQVLWTWPDGETCLADYNRLQIEAVDE